jgi:dienelactone hydrolase
LAIIGGKDHYTPPSDVAELAKLKVETQIYPDAEHGFAHDASRPSHRLQDAADAFSRTRAWLLS